jgi:hypothetical protein
MKTKITEYDEANVAWVHKTIEMLIRLGDYPMLATLRCTSDKEVLAIIYKYTSGLVDNEDVAIRTDLINEIVNLDKSRRFTESAEEIRRISEAFNEKSSSEVCLQEAERDFLIDRQLERTWEVLGRLFENKWPEIMRRLGIEQQ